MAKGLQTREAADPLARLLDEAGMAAAPDEIHALVRGVAAAPPGIEPEAWLGLLPSPPAPALKETLLALEAEARVAFAAERHAAATPERLAALRAELASLRLDGFLVPRADEHQGEYVPRAANRLAWLTGFTGSAGLAIVLKEKAAIFVDGRYTLQVREQVATDRFTPLHLTEDPPHAWLKAALKPGARIGFDPWLFTPSGLKPFARACKEAGAALVPGAANPVDRVWQDRPPSPISPVRVHDLCFAGEAGEAKRKRIAAALDDADAVFLSQPDSIAWLLNVRGGDLSHTPLPLSFALLYADASLDWFIDPRKVNAETKAHLGPGVRVRERTALLETLGGLGGRQRTVLLDPATTPVAVDAALRERGAVIRNGMDPCALPKACKNETELAGMRAAHRRDGAALTRFLALLDREGPKGGLTEISAADALEGFRRENEHFRGLSFPTISGAGAHGAIVHYRVTPETDARIAPDLLYLVDSGAQYLDGTTDVTRTVAIGAPTAEQRDRFTRVLKGHIALARARFPEGTAGSQLDALARAALWEGGLDYDHGTGHGVGSYLGVHEGPQRISKRADSVALRPGMILSDEPGYYETDAYGIRIESLVVVRREKSPPVLGFEVLTLAPIDRALIEKNLLDEEETAWLDAYHRRVFEALSPLLDASTKAWLQSVTAPL
ncbi:MAG: aminopeptidase P family protein [Alphaproteobacteria bacterium]|nr:aminopeptidase P family protein [Alphaproteobacteria bacterium]